MACAAPRRTDAAVGLKPWRRVFWLLLTLLAAGVLAAVAAFSAALQSEPAVAQDAAIGHDDVARALSLLRTHDPRRARAGAVSTALVRERDVEVMLSHGARRWVQAGSRVHFQRNVATLQLSAHLPPNPFGRWLNVDLQLAETSGLPAVQKLRVGRLPVPAWLAEWAVVQLAVRLGVQAELNLVTQVVRRVRFLPQQSLVTYAWQDDSMNRLLDGLVPADELARLRLYSDRVTALSWNDPQSWEMPLIEVLQPVFELARQRTAAGGDAAAENRAALTVLTLMANGRGIGSVLPSARQWPRPRPVRLLLAGRTDFPLHFLVSAALATEGTGPLSQAIGLYKEVTDSRRGSGFSFQDMAANRAGTRFGELLLRKPQAMQQRLAVPLRDEDLVPAVQDLPEYMPEAEFLRRFGGVGAPAYERVLSDIDTRITGLRLLR